VRKLNDNIDNRLFVANINFIATEEKLKDFFSSVGEVTNVVFINDRETGRFRGFGFVEMKNSELREEAIQKLNGRHFMGRPLAISKAKGRSNPNRLTFGNRSVSRRKDLSE